MSAAVRCNGCQQLFDKPALKHKLQTRVREGESWGLKHRDFCSDECLESWVSMSIEEREQALARRDAHPTPAAMPSRVPA